MSDSNTKTIRVTMPVEVALDVDLELSLEALAVESWEEFDSLPRATKRRLVLSCLDSQEEGRPRVAIVGQTVLHLEESEALCVKSARMTYAAIDWLAMGVKKLFGSDD